MTAETVRTALKEACFLCDIPPSDDSQTTGEESYLLRIEGVAKLIVVAKMLLEDDCASRKTVHAVTEP